MKSLRRTEKRTVCTSFRLFSVASFLAALLAAAAGRGSEAEGTVDRATLTAALAQDWGQVVRLLERVGPDHPSPLLRIIKGHACLAVNRNNESLCLFFGVSPEDAGAWDRWAADLARREPRSAIARYFAGDGAARRKRWTEAVASFTEALAIDPGCILALDARAVVHASQGRWDAAREDLIAAEAMGRPLADLHMTRGAFILHRRTDPKKALQRFEQALKISPDSVLALNGRGCTLTVLRRWDTAAQDLEAAARSDLACKGDVRNVLAGNLLALAEDRQKAAERAIARATGIEPGTSLEEKRRIWSTLSPGQKQLGLDIINNAKAFNDRVAGNPWFPKLEAGVSFGSKGWEGKLTGTWDFKGPPVFNSRQQDLTMKTFMTQDPTMKPNQISNFDAFILQKMPGSPFGKLTSPGGVSSREIAAEAIETGDWKVRTFYGLVYDLENAGKGPERKEPGGKEGRTHEGR